MEQKDYKVSKTWWVGWVTLFPLRFVYLMLFSLTAALIPTIFYGWSNGKNCYQPDQSKWRMGEK